MELANLLVTGIASKTPYRQPKTMVFLISFVLGLIVLLWRPVSIEIKQYDDLGVKMKEKIKKAVKAGSVLSTIIVGAIVGIMIMFQVGNVVTETLIHQRMWNVLALGDAVPGAGLAGVLRIYIMNHNTSVGVQYTQNISITQGKIRGYVDVNNTGMNINYSVAFDVIIKVRWNKTLAYNSSSHVWNLNWVNVTMTCSKWGIVNTSMTESNISGCTTQSYIWVNYYMNNTAVGYTLAKGDRVPTLRFYLRAYY